MILLFKKLSAPASIDDALGRGRRELERGKVELALEPLLSALTVMNAREETYATAVQSLSLALERMGEHRAALSACWYSSGPGSKYDTAERQRALLERAPPIDRARSWAAWADQDAGRKRELYAAAAGELERASVLARAAIYYERAGDTKSARGLWSRLAHLIDSERGERYVAGLAMFNLARMCRAQGDATAAREATVAAVHRLEEAADRFESLGQRERAFDCYHVLIEIGSATETFEHVLEGSVNAIRILSEDNLRYHALRLYEHAIRLAGRAGEHSAAASLAREMTDYARRQGLARIALRGTLTQAELWASVAESTQKRGGPVQLVENALLASLLSCAEVGHYRTVGNLYSRLEKLELEASRREHYARAARRYEDATDRPLDPGVRDERLGEHVGPPDVWHVDLLEWEERGSASEACADVLLDVSEDSDRITRRAALVGRLAALAGESADRSRSIEAAVIVADHLAPIGLYGLLSALEGLYTSPAPAVRLAAVRALSRYYYKRSFVTLEKAVADEDAGVAKEAVAAIERLRFDHAFDPLARIYRTAVRVDARLAALKAIARIDAPEAAELSLGVLEHGGPDERDAVMAALKAARGNRFVEVARATYPDASPKLRTALAEVLRSRGLTV